MPSRASGVARRSAIHFAVTGIASSSDSGSTARINSFALATAAGLAVIIALLAPISGSHINPVVTLTERAEGRRASGETGAYVVAQVAGGCLGAMLANLLFDLPVVELSTTDRSGWNLWLSEVVATAGLLPLVLAVLLHTSVFSQSFGYYLNLISTTRPFMYLMGPTEPLSVSSGCTTSASSDAPSSSCSRRSWRYRSWRPGAEVGRPGATSRVRGPPSGSGSSVRSCSSRRIRSRSPGMRHPVWFPRSC